MKKQLAPVLLRTARDVVIAVSLTLIAAEVCVRVLGLDPGAKMITMDVEPVDTPDGTFWPMPARYDPDGDGLRGAGIPGPATAAIDRSVVLLGDSIFFGVQIPADKRIGARLATGMRVYDASVPGYATTQMRISLQRVLAKRKPGAVVLSFFHNDTAVWKRSGDGVRRACLAFRAAIEGIGGASIDPDHAWWMYRNSALFRAVSGPWVHVDRACQERGERSVLRETARILTLGQEAGARVVIVLLADTGSNWADALRRRPEMKLYDEVRRLGESHGATVIDALPLLSKAPYADVALDRTGHLRPEGHRILAEAISDALGVLGGPSSQ